MKWIYVLELPLGALLRRAGSNRLAHLMDIHEPTRTIRVQYFDDGSIEERANPVEFDANVPPSGTVAREENM